MKSKIKILLTSEYGHLTGGGQRSILLLLERLDREKYDPVLLCREGGELLKEAEARGIETRIIEPYSLRSFHVIKIVKAFQDLSRLVKEEDVKLIHTDSPRWTFYLGIIARARKMPLIYHVRVSTPEPKLYERWLYFLSAKIIAVSQSARKRFEGFPKADNKVEVIYNAVDTKEFNPACDGLRVRKELGISDELLVGLIGEISSVKGEEEFLRAAAKVVEKSPHVRFIIVGKADQSFRDDLGNLIGRLSLKTFVSIYPARQDMPDVMAALDVLVNASRLEGFSRVILEAMASGKAVIATEVGGNPEAVDHNTTGILVPPKNPEGLAAAILELADNPQRRKGMGLAGRKKVEDYFSMDAQIKKIEAVYEHVCQGGPVLKGLKV